MLGHLEINMKVSDADMKITESNDCKEILRDNRDANGVLATIQERAKFSSKMDGNLLTYLPSQSVNCIMQASYIYHK